MSKSILVIDTPKSCSECQLRVMEYDLFYTNFACQNDFCETDNSLKLTRLEMNCPLKPLPERKPIFYAKSYEIDENMGFNKCLDEILGEE